MSKIINDNLGIESPTLGRKLTLYGDIKRKHIICHVSLDN